jgi:hypothetical protein
MSNAIIEGAWDELIARDDLRGRRVRIIVLDEADSDNPWVKSLNAWADSHKPLNHRIDDSRESIYSGTADDPR